MAETDLLQRMVDAAVQFTVESQKRAESFVRDLMKSSGGQADQASTAVTEFLVRTREGTETFMDAVWDEVRHQVDVLAVAGREALARLDDQVSEWRTQGHEAVHEAAAIGAATTGAKKASAKKAAGATKATKKAGAKKATKKAGAKKAASKKATAKKSGGKKAAAKKATTKKATTTPGDTAAG